MEPISTNLLLSNLTWILIVIGGLAGLLLFLLLSRAVKKMIRTGRDVDGNVASRTRSSSPIDSSSSRRLLMEGGDNNANQYGSSSEQGRPRQAGLVSDLGFTPDDASAVMGILQSPDEKVLGVLGQGWLGSFISGAGFSKAILVVTDSHLYMKGTLLNKVVMPNGHVVRGKVKRDLVVSLEDVQSSEVNEIQSGAVKLAIMTMGCLGVGGLLVLAGGEIFIVLGVVALMFGLAGASSAARLFLRGNAKELSIHYGANSVSVPVRWYPDEEVTAFRRQVTLAVQARRDARSQHGQQAPSASREQAAETVECPYCAETIKKRAVKCRYCGSDLRERN